ncbi:MAG: transposase [Ferrimicrobium sp.]
MPPWGTRRRLSTLAQGVPPDHVDPHSTVITNGWHPHGPALAGNYTHDRHVAPGELAHQLLPGVHRVASLLDRWLLGTHQGGVRPEHLPSYLDEFTFGFNRRSSRSPGLLFYRILSQAVDHDPISYRELVANPQPKQEPPMPPATQRRPASLEASSARRPWRRA